MADRELPIWTAAPETSGARTAPPTLISINYVYRRRLLRRMDARGRVALVSVNVATAGTYTLEARVASSGLGGTFHVEANGVNCRGRCRFRYRRLAGVADDHEAVTLTAGTQSIRIVSIHRRAPSAISTLSFHFAGQRAVAYQSHRDGGVEPEINLAWTDNASNETGFAIERSPMGRRSRADDGWGDVTSYQTRG